MNKIIVRIIEVVVCLGIIFLIYQGGIYLKNKKADQPSLLRTVVVGPELIDCVGVAPQKCMVVDGKYFYGQIIGFDYEEGYTYTIEIQETDIPLEQVPADASSIETKLVSILSKVQTGVTNSQLDATSWEYADGVISFKNKRYSANLGCNTLSGTYTEQGPSLTFKAGITTLIGCSDDLAQRESQFITDLIKIQNFTKEDENLILLGDDVRLILTSPLNNVLVGSNWNIQSIKEGSGIVSSAVDEGTFVRFATDKKVSGQSACNTFFGTYTTNKNTISIGPLATTRRACPEEQTNRERSLLESLAGIETYTIDRNTLKLQSNDREFRIELQAKN